MTAIDANTTEQKWSSRPVAAFLVRAFVFLFPIAVSVVFVFYASRAVPRPAGLGGAFLWLTAMILSSTVVLFLVDRLARKLMPIVALLRLSLIFPDSAPSRFKSAMRTNTVRQLKRQVEAGELDEDATPTESAEQLLRLATELNNHDRRTRGHTERVRAYTMMIGEEMSFTEDELNKLHWAGLVHDIGKLRVPAEILNLPGRPNEEQWKILTDHPRHGMAMVDPLRSWLGDWANAAGHHHERWDGTGYPYGLAGEDISLAGRVVAVADAFDVITSTRSYKEASSFEEARAEIARCAGSQFDPTVVKAFLRISIGNLRRVMGPLSWLAQAPVLAKIPVGTVAGPVSTAASSAAAVAVGIAASVGVSSSVAEPAIVEEVAPPISLGPIAMAAPEVLAPSLGAPEDTIVTVNIAQVGTETPISVTLGGDPSIAALDANGNVVVQPPLNYTGTIAVPATVCFDDGSCGNTVISVDFQAVNDAPVANPDQPVEVDAGESILIDVVANDTDADGDVLRLTGTSVDLVSGGFRRQGVGTARVVNNRIEYTAPAGFQGRVRVAYRVEDAGGLEAFGLVNVDVLEVVVPAPPTTTTAPPPPPPPPPTTTTPPPPPPPPPPTTTTTPPPAAPIAVADATVVAEDASASIDVLANDDAGSGVLDPSTVTIVEDPKLGVVLVDASGRIDYKPKNDVHGADSLRYEVCNSEGLCATGDVTIDILPINDPPTFSGSGDVTVDEDSGPYSGGWATAISGGASPSETNEPVTFTATVEDPSLFSVQPAIDAGGRLTFTPAPNANGMSTIVVVATDGLGGDDTSLPVTFKVTVEPLNDPPLFTSGGDISVLEDSGPYDEPWATSISGGALDEIGEPVTFVVTADDETLFTDPPVIAADGSLSFIAAPNAVGSTDVTVIASDGLGGDDTAAPVVFAIALGPVNDPPVAVDDPGVAATENATAHEIVVVGNDSDPDHLVADLDVELVSLTTSAGGVVQLKSGSDQIIEYTPPRHLFGTAADSFQYQVRDPDGGTSGVATVTIDLSNVVTAPIASDDGYLSLPAGISLGAEEGVLANDYDLDGAALAVSSTLTNYDTGNGRLTLAADGSFSYLPNVGFFGTDSIAYTVVDGAGGATATLSILVTPTASTSPVFLRQQASPSGSQLAWAPPTEGTPGDPDGDTEPGVTLGNLDSVQTPGSTWTWEGTTGIDRDYDGPIAAEVMLQTLGTATGPSIVTAKIEVCDPTCAVTNTSSVEVALSPGVFTATKINLGALDRFLPAGTMVRLTLEATGVDMAVATTAAEPSFLIGYDEDPVPVASAQATTIDENGADQLNSVSVVVVGSPDQADLQSIDVIGAPAGWTVVTDPGDDNALKITPAPFDKGVFTVNYSITDDANQTSLPGSITVTVVDVNLPPTFLDPGAVVFTVADGVMTAARFDFTADAGAPDETAIDYGFVLVDTIDPSGIVQTGVADIVVGPYTLATNVPHPGFTLLDDLTGPLAPLNGLWVTMRLSGTSGESATFEVALVELDGGGGVVGQSVDTFFVTVTIA